LQQRRGTEEQLWSTRQYFSKYDILTDQEIRDNLELPGGRQELRNILVQGSLARQKLIRCNLRLVVSIAKKWSKGGNSGGDYNLGRLYEGSDLRPSLDDAIQEGIVGLAQAAHRYDPSRKLRFSTYATYYITNGIRSCFQRVATGVINVPAPFHEIAARYKALIREGNTLPTAEQVGVSQKRIDRALKYTRPTLSLDATVSTGGARTGSQAGEGAGRYERPVFLSDTMQCPDPRPEDLVELSLLRQVLENAMATELSPHERDVVRLRLGLDDGVARTPLQVSQVCGGDLSQVRLAEKRAYRKMSSPYSVHTRELLSYLHFCDGRIES
jgi:RNA polymerase primary sigma factor